MKKERILILNLGSTSSKFAVYDDDKEILKETIRHTAEEMAQFSGVIDQFDFRKDIVYKALGQNGISLESLTAVCSRGGKILPCPHGAIGIDNDMVEYLTRPEDAYPHASLLGSLIAYDLKTRFGIPACIYDAIGTDEILPIARVTGVPDLPRFAVGHTLNTRAMGIKCAEEILGKPFDQSTIIVAHLGSGNSIRIYHNGINIDCVNDDESNFAIERGGGVTCKDLVLYCKECFDAGMTAADVGRKFQGDAGLMGHLGTTDAIEVERRISTGDKYAEIVYQAMAYRVSKDIAALAAAVSGKVDRIILTGGIAYSKMFTGWITERVDWIAPVEIMGGEYEMEALAAGALRVLQGKEELQVFSDIAAGATDRIRICEGVEPQIPPTRR